MTAKKFKRVIPGQFEKLKEMFEGYEFDFSSSCPVECRDYKGEKVTFGSMKGESADSISVDCFLKLKNGLSVCISFDVVNDSNTYEFSSVIFFQTKDFFSYESMYERYTGKGKSVIREKLDYIIPTYERLYDCVDHLDYKCIEYIKDLFFMHVNMYNSVVNAIVRAKIECVTFKGMVFSSDEINEAMNLIEVDNVLSL